MQKSKVSTPRQTKNGINRYICTNCGKRFNQNTGHNIPTKKELIANQFLNFLFAIENDYFIDTKKYKEIINTKKIVRDILKNENLEKSEVELKNEQLEFINIKKGSKNVAEVKNDGRNLKEYHINEYSKDFLISLRDGPYVYLLNKISDTACKKLILEIPEYTITIEKKTDRYKSQKFSSNFKKLINKNRNNK